MLKKRGENILPCLNLYEVGVKKIEKPLDFWVHKSYNIITVKENLMSKAGKEPERRKRCRIWE